MKIVLLGEPESKRTKYFQKAAAAFGVTVAAYPYHSFYPDSFAPAFVKLDPYAYGTSELARLEKCISYYRENFKRLSKSKHLFFNAPQAILEVLDKRGCKETLIKYGVPVTPMLLEPISCSAYLQHIMIAKRWLGVFIKPRYGSGAAGVLAYRFHPRTGREVLYTSVRLQKDTLINTKQLQRMDSKEEIKKILDITLLGDNVIEQWLPKASFEGKPYDLRVVVQFGQLDYMIARQSKGPITNLHLNNGAVSIDRLALTEQVLNEIERVAINAYNAFPGLRYAGIDILLLEESLQPYVIEVNGQGDLIYQDIFHENIIYKHQIQYYLEQNRGSYEFI